MERKHLEEFDANDGGIENDASSKGVRLWAENLVKDPVPSRLKWMLLCLYDNRVY